MFYTFLDCFNSCNCVLNSIIPLCHQTLLCCGSRVVFDNLMLDLGFYSPGLKGRSTLVYCPCVCIS